MKHFLLVLGLILMLASAVGSAPSCFVVTPDFPQAYKSARAVFIGEVVKLDQPLTSDPNALLRDRLYKARFKVEYSWKGAGFRDVGLHDFVVLSDQGQPRVCGSWGAFREGEKYLVFAYETADKDLIVQFGNRTTRLSEASTDLQELRRLDLPLILPPKPGY